MSRGSELLFGIDLGTKKITVVAAEKFAANPDEAQIIAIGQAPSRGIRKGAIVNLEQAVSAVSDAVADAESMLSNVKISDAAVAFSATDLKCRVLHGMISLGRSARSIAPEDIERVIETALSTLRLAPGLCVVHSIPIKYAVDGSEGIENPLDMTGTRLEVDLTALIIPISVAQNIAGCVEKAGVKVSGLLLKPLAESLGALSRDEREMGATLITIGAGTTAVSVFSEGHLLYAGEIPVGGDHISNDISTVLKIPFATADEIKKSISVSPNEAASGAITINTRGRTREIKRADVRENIELRLDELFTESIVPALSEIIAGENNTEVILTGGVMLTEGFALLAENYLGTSVRIASPLLSHEMPDDRNDCRYCAAAGIIIYLTEKSRNPFSYVEPPMNVLKSVLKDSRNSSRIKAPKRPSQTFVKSFIRNVGELFKELF